MIALKRLFELSGALKYAFPFICQSFCAILMRSTNWKLCYTEKVKMVRKFIPAGLYLAFLTSRSQYKPMQLYGQLFDCGSIGQFHGGSYPYI